MHRLRSPLLVLACLGLLASQLSGLHMHMDAQGYVGMPTGTHVHGTAVHPHDGVPSDQADEMGDEYLVHEGDRDVSVMELGAGASKVLIFFAWFGLCLLIIFTPTGRVWIPAVLPPPKIRRGRWRPPLRAPPAFSH